LARSGESFRRFRRAWPARCEERVAVGHVQMKPPLPLRLYDPDLFEPPKRLQKPDDDLPYGPGTNGCFCSQ
jgi:hypothetical protein